MVVSHVLSAAFWTITILGNPFAIQHQKLTRLALVPVNMIVVSREIFGNANRSPFA